MENVGSNTRFQHCRLLFVWNIKRQKHPSFLVVPCCKQIKPLQLKCCLIIVSSQAAIRKELNEFKSSEMEVHEESRIYTRSGSYTSIIHLNCSPSLFSIVINTS